MAGNETLPDVRSLGARQTPRVNAPILSTDAGTAASRAALGAAEDFAQMSQTLRDAGDRIQTRNEAIERLRAERDFRDQAGQITNEFLSSADIVSPDAVKKYGALIGDLERKAIEGHPGRAESQVQLSQRLQAFKFGVVDQVSKAGYSAQQAMINDQVEMEINTHMKNVSDDPANMLTEYGTFASTVDELPISAEEKITKKNTGLAILAEATINGFIDSHAIRDVPGMMNDALDILNHPQVAGALGEGRQARIRHNIKTALKPVKPTAMQEKITTLVETGVDENTAKGIAAGRFVVSVNPQTNERVVMDVSTGLPVGGKDQPSIPVIPKSSMPESIDISSVTGFEGVGTNIYNIVSDGFGFGAGYPKAQEATEALTNLGIRTTTLMQSAIPGRPSKFLLEQLGKLAIEPNSFFTGESKARIRMEQTRDMISTEIMRMDGLLSQGDFKPDVRQEMTLNKTQLEGVLADYNKVIESIGQGTFNYTTPEEIGAAEFDEIRTFVQGASREELQQLDKSMLDAIEDRLNGGQ